MGALHPGITVHCEVIIFCIGTNVLRVPLGEQHGPLASGCRGRLASERVVCVTQALRSFGFENGLLPNVIVIQVSRSREDDDALADCEAPTTGKIDKLPKALGKAVL